MIEHVLIILIWSVFLVCLQNWLDQFDGLFILVVCLILFVNNLFGFLIHSLFKFCLEIPSQYFNLRQIFTAWCHWTIAWKRRLITGLLVTWPRDINVIYHISKSGHSLFFRTQLLILIGHLLSRDRSKGWGFEWVFGCLCCQVIRHLL